MKSMQIYLATCWGLLDVDATHVLVVPRTILSRYHLSSTNNIEAMLHLPHIELIGKEIAIRKLGGMLDFERILFSATQATIKAMFGAIYKGAVSPTMVHIFFFVFNPSLSRSMRQIDEA